MKKSKAHLWWSLLLVFTGACDTDNLEDLYGIPEFSCDPQQVTFSAVIQPIIETNCAVPGCHIPGTGRQNFKDPLKVQLNAPEIKQRTQSRDMPRGGRSLSQTEINQIACWVDSGADISN